MSDTVLKVENLYKEYRLGVVSHGVLFRDLQSFWAKVRGKEDPNSLVTSLSSGHSNNVDQKNELKQHFLALDNISFEVKQGEALGIIGKNGAGKSTLLKVLSRITGPTSGSVKIKGRIASLLEVGTGFHPEMTGRENVYMNGAILGMRRWQIAQKMDEIIAFAGLEKFIDTPVKRYSSGMYVRLAFAVAAYLDAEILVMDEVLAVGDVEFQKKALGKMNDVAKSGRTVLFVSHNMQAIKGLCSRGLLLENGICCFSGNVMDTIAEYIKSGNLLETSSEKIYVPDEAKPFQVMKVEILNKEEKRQTAYEAQEEIKVRIHCVSRESIPGLYGYFRLTRDSGETIIICDSQESSSDVFNNLAPGKYTVDLTIPSGLLASGNYIPLLNFTSQYLSEFHIDSPMEILTFRVTDSTSSRGNGRNALTSIVLDWRLTA